GPCPDRRQAGRRPRGRRRRRGRDRHGHRPRRLPRGQLPEGVRRDHRREGGLRGERPAQGHLRDRRAVHVRQHPPGELARHAGRGRLHQDLDRQGGGQRHARQHPADAPGGARLPRPDRHPGRREAGRRHPHQQGRHQVPRPGQRDGGRGLAGQPLVPLRRLLAAQRPADAAAEAGHRPLLRPRLRHGGLITMASAFEYAPAPESRSVVDIAPSNGLFIDGEFAEAADGKVFKTVSPATEEVLSEVAEAGEADIDRAVGAARKALEKWSALPGSERTKYLYRIARIIQERSRELAVLETLDNGKPIKETRDADLPLVAAHFFYYAGWADKLDHAGFGANPRPLGVAGQVIPWNFPLLMLAWKIAPALATGNTVVLKPAETTPLSALFFADVCRQAGLPRGVVNIVTGDGRAGAALVAHPDVNKVAFTGSTAVGKQIARNVAGTRKKVTLELGGKGANIVFDDAPVDQAVEGIVNGIFFNQGQVCCAGSRLLVQESVEEEVLDALKRRLSMLRLGDPLDKNTDIGAINSEEQLSRITSLVERGEAE